MRRRRRPALRMVAGQAQQVAAVFARHARTTRRGVPVRCRQPHRSLGPIILPSHTAARAAVAELAAIGQQYTETVCVYGRHWHLRPAPKENNDVKPYSQPLTDDVPSWLVSRDGNAVRDAARGRLGAEAAVVDLIEDDEACDSPNCNPCVRRKKAREEKPSATA